MSGLVFAAIVLGWAAYLIPHALRRYDQASRSRSIDRFSSAMRVLARKDQSDAVATVKPSGPPPTLEQTRARRRVQRVAARAAARRRRRILMLLMACTAATVTVAALGYLPWWSVAIPAAPVLLFLIASSRRVRRESDSYWESAPPVSRAATRVESAYGSVQQTKAMRMPAKSPAPPRHAEIARDAGERNEDAEPTVVIDCGDIAQLAVPVQTSDGGVLWDPVPVTLPTYVSKPKAARTIRTIDLAQPGTWTSGNTEEATALAQQTGEAEAGETTDSEMVEAPPRAVGT